MNRRWFARASSVAVVCVVVVAAAVVLGTVSDDAAVDAPRPPAGRADTTAVTVQPDVVVPYVGAPHRPYNSFPPTSGARVPQTLAPGVYRWPVPPEIQVSVLRQGDVIVQYSPSLPASAVRLLTEVFRANLRSVLVSPQPLLPAGVALTAWGRSRRLPTVDAAEIQRFVTAHAR